MREKIAIKSSTVGIICKLAGYLLSFIIARYFMKYLGVEIRGINGVLSNVLGFLQLAELGFGTAIIYALYEPLAKNEVSEIKALMRLYKIIYRIVGLVIILGGAILTPLALFLIDDTTYSVSYIVLVYFIQLATSASTYFLAYKRNLMYADQKQYIATFLDAIVNVISGIIRIFVIIYTKNYIAYLLVQVAQNVISNVVVNIWCNKQYPFLKEPVTEKYKKSDKLKANVKNLMIGRIAGWVYSSTDNMIISKFAGVVTVGFISNYYVLTGMLKGIVDATLESIRPIIGNFIASNDDKKASYNIFMSYTFIRYCIANVVTVGLVLLASPVVTVWIGGEYIVDQILVILLAIDVYIHITHASLTDFVNVLGLFKDDRNMAIVGALINLVMSLSLVPLMGTPGVLLGTCISQIYYWCVRGYIVLGKYYKFGTIKYVLNVTKYTAVTVAEIWGLGLLFKMDIFAGNGLGMVIIKGLVVIFVSMAAAILTNLGTSELKYALGIVKRNILKNEK